MERGNDSVSNLRSAQYHAQKAKASSLVGDKNMADDVLKLASKVGTDNWVQQVVFHKGGVPSFVAYSEEMMKMIISYCDVDSPKPAILCKYNFTYMPVKIT